MTLSSMTTIINESMKIPGWANIDTMTELHKCAISVPKNGTIIELGAMFGRSTHTLGFSKDESVKLITIDRWHNLLFNGVYSVHDNNSPAESIKVITDKIVNEKLSGINCFEIWKQFTSTIPNLQGLHDVSTLNHDAFPMVDMIYHDAGHEYPDVYNDLIHWFPKLKKSGFIMIDDYSDDFPGVIQSVDQFVKEYNLILTKVTSRNVILKQKAEVKHIGFIGVGKLGQDCAEVIADHGYTVEGYDSEHRTPSNFNMADSIRTVVQNKNLIFIAVPTPHEAAYSGSSPITNLPVKDFDYSIVQAVLTEVNKFVNENQLVVLISTVLPGTVRNHLAPCITNARFIYNPYLIAMGSVKWDMINPECLIIGTEDGSETGDAAMLVDFYKTIMANNPRINIGTWDEAESIKIFYNTFISAKIGLVNLIQDVAEKNGNINVDVVTDALKAATQRITGPRYLTAGLGDSGGCHPRDNIALRYLADKLDLGYDLFHAIMHSRDKQAENMANRLIGLAKKYSLPVVIHGKAYKPYVSYTDGSYSLLVGHFVESAGIALQYADPLTGDYIEAAAPAVVLMAHNPAVTYSGTGVEITVADYYFDIHPGSIILDPWRTIKEIPGCEIIHYGNTRFNK